MYLVHGLTRSHCTRKMTGYLDDMWDSTSMIELLDQATEVPDVTDPPQPSDNRPYATR